MADIRQSLNPEQLLTACGVLESTMLSFIIHCERRGIDVNELRQALDDAHNAVDGLRSEGGVS